MLDIPSVSAIAAAVGVIIGVVFTALQLRDLVRTRQTDLVIRLYSTFGSNEYQEATRKVMALEFKDYRDYVKKGGCTDVVAVGTLFEGIGVLLHRKLIDIGLVDDLFSEPINVIWRKMKPWIESDRKRLDQPRMFEWFEYIYNEMQRRAQRPEQIQQ